MLPSTAADLVMTGASSNLLLVRSGEDSPLLNFRRRSERLNSVDKSSVLHKAMSWKARLLEGEGSRVVDHTVRKAIHNSRSCGVNLGVAKAESFVGFAAYCA